MENIKLFAISCAPGAEATCDWVMQEIARREQFEKYMPLLAVAIILFTVAVFLILALIVKTRADRKSRK